MAVVVSFHKQKGQEERMLLAIISVGVWTAAAAAVWSSFALQLWEDENDHSLAGLARKENTKSLYKRTSAL